MYKMNKRLVYLLVSLFLFCFAFTASAQRTNPLGADNFKDLFAGIATAIGQLVAGLGTIMVIISGVMYMTSAGDAGKIAGAKKSLTYAILGILVGSAASAIASFAKEVASKSTLSAIVDKIVTEVSTISGSLGAAMCIVAGIMYLTSGGDPGKVKTAKTALVYAVVGMVIGLSGAAIVAMVRSWAS